MPTANKAKSNRNPSKSSVAARGSAQEKSVVESTRSKRKQIVKAATTVFLNNGFEGTSVAKVAETAGVIKATIYSHFKDKRTLFKAIVENVTVEKGVFELEIEIKSIEPEFFFKALANRVLERIADPQFRSLIRVVIGESGRFPELSQLFYETVSCRGNKLIAGYFKKHPELRLKDAEASAQIVTGSLVYWMLSQEVMGGNAIAPMDPKRIVGALEALFLDRIE